jgi:hypothetical protein
VTFDETIDLLDHWAGRDVCAAVRTPPDGEPKLVAVLLGSIGAVETARGRPEEEAAFVPIRVSDSSPLGEAVGLQLDRDDFEDASGEPEHLHLRLRDAAVEVVRR